MNVKIKKLHPDAVIPKYAKPGDAGLDLTAVWAAESNGMQVYGTGLAIEIPEGYVGLIFPRSSIKNRDVRLTNCVGVIDSGYRGEIAFVFDILDSYDPSIYAPGERIGQIIILPYPQIDFTEIDELSESERGADGFGSSGD